MGKKILQKDRKHCEKRRFFSLRAISPFPKVLAKDLYCRHVRNKQRLLWERVNAFRTTGPFYHVIYSVERQNGFNKFIIM